MADRAALLFGWLHVLRCDIQVDRYGNNRQIFEHPVADTELLSLLNQRLAYYLDYRIKDLQATQRNAMQCDAMQCMSLDAAVVRALWFGSHCQGCCPSARSCARGLV